MSKESLHRSVEQSLSFLLGRLSHPVEQRPSFSSAIDDSHGQVLVLETKRRGTMSLIMVFFAPCLSPLHLNKRRET
jgi:hypothetical protein